MGFLFLIFKTFLILRHILSTVHFNNNLQREVKKLTDGTEQVKVVYPKFKNGEATVRNIRVAPNYGMQNCTEIVIMYSWKAIANIFSLDYVDELYKLFLKCGEDTLNKANKELVDMSPAPMDNMLEKQPRTEALKNKEIRKGLVAKDVPPTAPGQLNWMN